MYKLAEMQNWAVTFKSGGIATKIHCGLLLFVPEMWTNVGFHHRSLSAALAVAFGARVSLTSVAGSTAHVTESILVLLSDVGFVCTERRL